MRIWIDADACPVVVKDVILKAAYKLRIETVFVANKAMFLPDSPLFRFEKVEAGPDIADKYILDNAEQGDLVVTQDIPLAHGLITTGIVAINPRGVVYTPDNIGDRLATRDLMQSLRDGGEMGGGPKTFGDKEKRLFASSFDRELSKLRNRK